jgi:putative salt-induced outer membrane protein YdiY
MLAAAAFFAAPAFADTVTLKNGDKLTGDITEVSPQHILVTTPYAGKITIERPSVRTLQSDHLVTILRPDGSRDLRYLAPATQPAVAATAAAPATQNAAVGWSETETPNIPPTGIAPPAVAVTPQKSDAKPKRFSHYLDLGPDWQNTLAIGAINSSGNDETTSFSADLTLHYQKKTEELTAKFQSLYGTSQGAQTAGLVDQNTVYRHDLTTRWYSYASDDVRYDEIKGISLQAQGSAGLGYYFFRGERFKLDLRAGPGVTYLRTFDSNTDLAPSAEAAIRLAYQINDHLKASHETSYTTSLFDTEVWRVHSETALNYKLDLERGLGLKLAYNDDYENRPSRNRRPNDSRVSLSLTLDF